jgi:calcineurin-like phosphoesterase family protein
MIDWVTADQHFDHAVLARDRGFASLDEMNVALVRAWNRVVGPLDRVWVLGDFCWEYREALGASAWLAKLYGVKVIVRGNHDKPKQFRSPAWAARHQAYHREVFPELGEVVFTHIPFVLSLPGTVMLHGHEHGRGPRMPRYLDVGVDCHGWSPIRLVDAVRMARSMRPAPAREEHVEEQVA